MAVIPGDNVGPEVVAQGLRVLKRLEDLGFCAFDTQSFSWGAGEYLRTGRAAPDPDEIVAVLREFDAIYFGAHGDPSRVPDWVASQQLMHPLRQGLDLYVNLRPIKLFHGVESPLKAPGDIDFVVVRENTEGEYSPIGGRAHPGLPHEVAVQTAVVTRQGAERVIRFAFELARARDQKRRVHCVTKSNAMVHIMSLWDEVFETIARQFPDIETSKSHVDATSMYLVSRPSTFDVIVATNLMGDILSDEAAAVTGSIGLAVGGNLNPERRYPSLFEPIHGSAPDIAGRGIANPLAAIGALALLLDWVGETLAASMVSGAIADVLARREVRTRDLGGDASTADMTDAIIEAITAGPALDGSLTLGGLLPKVATPAATFAADVGAQGLAAYPPATKDGSER